MVRAALGRAQTRTAMTDSAGEARLKATRPVKHSFTLAGHRTSISLEAAFWDALKTAAAERGMALAELVRHIDGSRGEAGLSSAVRVWVLDHVMGRAARREQP